MTAILRKRLDVLLVGLLVLALGVLAFLHPGVRAAELELNDGGVWVTNGAKNLVAHLNYDARTLDGGLRSQSSDADLSQAGTDVVITTAEVVSPIDPATVTLTGEANVAGITVAIGADSALFARPGNEDDGGAVWATTAAQAGTFNAAADPILSDLDEPRVVVGTDGTGYVVTADGVVRSVTGAGSSVETKEIGRLDAEIGAAAQLAVAGDRLLVLDGGTLRMLGRSIDLGVEGGVLQQSGSDREVALVATDDALLRVSLGGGQVQSVADVPSGDPAAPVSLDGCAYGLWAGSGFYVRECGDASGDEAAQYPELTSAAQPVFRVNRSAIVINDLVSGAVYLPLESMERVDNWDLIAAQVKETEQETDQDTEETDDSQLAEFSEEQHPPVANDDELGARPGVATTLPVLLNDTDLDGDVLTAVLGDVPQDVTVALARNGRAVRVEVPGDRTAPFEFTYQANDGTDLSNVARVRVSISQAGSNGAPERLRKTSITVAERATAEFAVLQDWVDPDGDPIYLANAVGDEGLAVTWRPDGHISVRDLGTHGPGRRVVTVEVSDGTAATTEEITVQVMPGATNQPPVANFDHYVANVGETVTLDPLANDTDPEDAELRLVELGQTDPSVTVQRESLANTIQFTATRAGTQIIVYAITDGPNTAKGKIRVDVSDPAAADPQPAAENDLALLPASGTVLVEPLSNDFDPAGGLLVIQGVSLGSSEGLTVEVVRHSSLRVTAPAGLSEPQTFEYTVSNGTRSATATVLVIPLKESSTIQAPVALPEETVVRAGDIVTVDVLANDYSPSDLAINLRPELQVRGVAGGEFFVAADAVRFKAGDEAGQVEATYTVEDTEGNVASSTVTITVIGFDTANQAPVPQAVEARTFAGMNVLVPIPMDGVDPDGDSVELVGVSGARLGSVTLQGNYLDYQAGDAATGTDTFTYRVRDRFGAEGEGTVRVGVAPAPAINQPPVAVLDEVAARPNTRLEIPVTRNDVDPDGDDISLVADSIEPITQGWDPQAEIKGQKVIVLTPADKGIYQFYYRITDGGGSPVTGVATVEVDENVPPQPPVAQDDYVTDEAISGLAAVEVPVLDNDSDPDGVAEDLEVSVEGDATVSGGVVTVPVTDDRRVVLYTVTDRDGLTAKAAIIVPGAAQTPPFLDPAKVPAVIKGGETLTIDFAEYVVTREGHAATLTAVESVVAGQGGNTADPDLGLKVESDTVITFTPDVLFKGATSVTFQVTDGDTVDDPRGIIATLSLPITVESSGLFPPEVRPSEVQVSPGERPLEVSLAAMVDDPDPGDNETMTYTIVSQPGPFTVDVTGQTAQVSVAADVAVGTTGSVVLRVHDGSTEPVEMTVPLRVVGSTRPTMVVTDISENDGRVGKAVTWNLADYVTNPFADVGGEVSLVGQPRVTGPATVSVSGLNLVVTPTDSGGGGDAAEQAVITYTVADATKDSSRNKTGVIRVTVKDTPKAPVDVSAEYVGSRTARVTWSHTGWRGGTRSGFLVSWNGGSKACGLVTSCVIDTLANNNTYSFTVQAQVTESDITDSAPSAASNAVFVDVAPSQPSVPKVSFGDGEVTLSWPQTSVPDGGSPVTRHTVEISPADQSGRTQIEVAGGAQSGWTWTNLRNGVEYRFRISAHNNQTDADNRVTPPQGGWSEGVIPAGKPSLLSAPSVVKDKASAGVTPRATVSWAAPGNPNGDSSFTYRLRMSGSSEILYEGPAASRVVPMAVGTDDKAFEVQATNKSQQWSDWSAVSNKIRAFQPPGAPTGFTLKPTGVSNQVQFSFSAAPGNGAKTNEISYRWSAGGASGIVTNGQSVTSGVFVNGSNVAVTLTAISTVNGETATGGSASATVNAYGPPAAPSVSAGRAGNGNVDYSWSMPSASNGRSVEVQITTTQNGTQRTVALSGSAQEGTAHDQTRCIKARAVNSEGQASAWVEKCATTRGSGSALERAGGAATCPPGVTPGRNGCRAYEVELVGWYPHAQVICTADSTNGSGSHSQTYTVNADGWARGRLASMSVAIDWAGFKDGSAIGGCRYA